MEEFKVGDIVYHKLNNLKMVIIADPSSQEFSCRYIGKDGDFHKADFRSEELTKDGTSGEVKKNL